MKKAVMFLVLIAGVFWFVGMKVNVATNEDGEKELVVASAASRVAEVRKIQTAMELYFTEWGRYPEVGETCQSIAALEPYLVPDYLDELPSGAESGLYHVSVDQSGWHFVLQTDGAGGSGVLLNADTEQDGQVLGCDCDDPNFCVTEYEDDPEKYQDLYL